MSIALNTGGKERKSEQAHIPLAAALLDNAAHNECHTLK